MRTITIALVASFALGCSSAPTEQTEPDRALFADQVSDDDRQQMIPGPIQPAERPPEAEPTAVGEDEVEVAQVLAGDPYITASQLKFTVVSKNPTRDGLELTWRIEKGDESIDGFWTGRPFYYEATAFGALYSLSANDGQTMVTFHGKAPDAPIDVATAAKIATPEIRERLDCKSGERVIVVGDTNGTIKVQSVKGDMDNPDVQCTVRVGLYTERVIDP